MIKLATGILLASTIAAGAQYYGPLQQQADQYQRMQDQAQERMQRQQDQMQREQEELQRRMERQQDQMQRQQEEMQRRMNRGRPRSPTSWSDFEFTCR